MRRRSFLLLEVVVGLALLGLLGVQLVRIQTQSVRQIHAARLQREVGQRVQEMLWEWSERKTPVTLPATGRWDDGLTWRRASQPLRVATDVLPRQISLTVYQSRAGEPDAEIYRVAWLVPGAREAQRERGK